MDKDIVSKLKDLCSFPLAESASPYSLLKKSELPEDYKIPPLNEDFDLGNLSDFIFMSVHKLIMTLFQLLAP